MPVGFVADQSTSGHDTLAFQPGAARSPQLVVDLRFATRRRVVDRAARCGRVATPGGAGLGLRRWWQLPEWDADLRAMTLADEATLIEQGMLRVLAHTPPLAACGATRTVERGQQRSLLEPGDA